MCFWLTRAKSNNFNIKKNIPEDSVNITPDVLHFYFFSGRPVRDIMCNMFFLKILGSIFTLLRLGDRPQESFF